MDPIVGDDGETEPSGESSSVTDDFQASAESSSRAEEPRRKGFTARKVVGLICLAIVVSYMVIAPTIETFMEQFEERPSSYVVEPATPMEMLRIRSAKLFVFAFFTYFGACVGSFLNVVAASAPLKESIVIRSSACPKCGALILRRDNWPIVSYLLLQGRCRACNVKIPIRYLLVELIVAGIFMSLFLVELVTGAANVPGVRYYPPEHTGILWMIWFTKWLVVGIYFYHAILFSSVLTVALMEIDRLRCPANLAILAIAAFAAIGIIVPDMAPVAFDDQLKIQYSETLPIWVARTLTCLIGGCAGLLLASVGGFAGRFFGQQPGSVIAWVLVGIAMGWQASITIAAIWLLVSIVVQQIQKGNRLTWVGPAAILFISAAIHHPFWKQFADSLW